VGGEAAELYGLDAHWEFSRGQARYQSAASCRTHLEGGEPDDPFSASAVHHAQLQREIAPAQRTNVEARPRSLETKRLYVLGFALAVRQAAPVLRHRTSCLDVCPRHAGALYMYHLMTERATGFALR